MNRTYRELTSTVLTVCTDRGPGRSSLFNFYFSNMQVLENTVYCLVGWVNLYKKFEIKKYTVCGKLILAKNGKDFFKFFLAQLACEYAWI